MFGRIRAVFNPQQRSLDADRRFRHLVPSGRGLRARRTNGLRLRHRSRRYGVFLRKRAGGRTGGARSRTLRHPPRIDFRRDEALSHAVRRSGRGAQGIDRETGARICRHDGSPSSGLRRRRGLPHARTSGGAGARALDRALELVREGTHGLSSPRENAARSRAK